MRLKEIKNKIDNQTNKHAQTFYAEKTKKMSFFDGKNEIRLS